MSTKHCAKIFILFFCRIILNEKKLYSKFKTVCLDSLRNILYTFFYFLADIYVNKHPKLSLYFKINKKTFHRIYQVGKTYNKE